MPPFVINTTGFSFVLKNVSCPKTFFGFYRADILNWILDFLILSPPTFSARFAYSRERASIPLSVLPSPADFGSRSKSSPQCRQRRRAEAAPPTPLPAPMPAPLPTRSTAMPTPPEENPLSPQKIMPTIQVRVDCALVNLLCQFSIHLPVAVQYYILLSLLSFSQNRISHLRHRRWGRLKPRHLSKMPRPKISSRFSKVSSLFTTVQDYIWIGDLSALWNVQTVWTAFNLHLTTSFF